MEGWIVKPEGWEEVEYKYINVKKPKIINFNKEIDGIFVLAGGLNDRGLCHPWVIRRLDLAYQIHLSTNKPIFCLGGGTYHKPPILNKSKYVIHESTSCSEYLIKLGVKPNMIYKEWSSYDTIANGYFGFSNYILPLKLKSIILITSNFHIERSKEIFEWIKKIFDYKINIRYLSVTDKDLDENIIKVRNIREKDSLLKLKKYLINKIANVKDFHKWFFTEHNAYCSNSELIRKKSKKDIQKSY